MKVIESEDLNEALVLTVQTRTDAIKAAVEMVSNVPASLGIDPTQSVIDVAKRFEKYIQSGKTQ